MAKRRSSSHARGRSGLPPASDIASEMSAYRLIASALPPAPDAAGISGERLSLTQSGCHCLEFVKLSWSDGGKLFHSVPGPSVKAYRLVTNQFVSPNVFSDCQERSALRCFHRSEFSNILIY